MEGEKTFARFHLFQSLVQNYKSKKGLMAPGENSQH